MEILDLELPRLQLGKRYQILHPIGRGGMGAIYAVLDRLTGQMVALKSIVLPCLQWDESTEDEGPTAEAAAPALKNSEVSASLRLALAREFQTLSSLRHPNIISVLDYGVDAVKNPYFSMELLPSPQNLVAAGEGLSIHGKVLLVAQLLRALVYLHRRGIIHRDIIL